MATAITSAMVSAPALLLIAEPLHKREAGYVVVVGNKHTQGRKGRCHKTEIGGTAAETERNLQRNCW
ncbi:MAG: hypothetical protein ACOVSW_12940, partial [Candidatus Kapaibacteriota bacterium]